ncbi:MAG TPA: sigma 54-interacting transcriptional regulator [bacterium]|nr:sigma 54-interacting transcriptional regulator [bacterium]
MSGTTDAPDKVQALRAQLAAATTPAERVEAALLLAEALWLSDPVAARPLLEQVLAEADAAGRPKDKGRAAYVLGELLRRAGDLGGATRCAETVFQVADATADRLSRAKGLNLLGIIHRDRSEFQAALDCFKEFLEITRQTGSRQGERIALNELAGVYGLQGEFDEALACYQQCLKVSNEVEDAHGKAIALHNIGWTLAAMGRWVEATQNFYRVMELCEDHGLSDPLDAARMALGELSLKRSDYEDAALMFRTVAEGEREKQRSGRMYREALSNLGWTHFLGGDLAKAQELLNEATLLCEAAKDRKVLAALSRRRAEIALAQGRLEAAGDLLAQAEHHATDLNLKTEQGEVMRVQALLSAARGASDHALELFNRSEVKLEPLGDTFELALTRLQHGRELLAANRPEEARLRLQAAAQTFRRLAVVAEAEEASRLLYRIEMQTDLNSALLQAMLSITTLGLAPEQFIERALSMLCDNMRFEQGAVLIDGSPVATLGNPDLTVRGQGLGARGQEHGNRIEQNSETRDQKQELTRNEERGTPSGLEQTDLELLLPVRQAEAVVGLIVLRRSLPLKERVNPEALEVVSGTLAPALAKLGKLRAIESDTAVRIPGLRFRGVVGRNRVVLDVLSLAVRMAAPRVQVLIRGESGTGKELIARALHESGPRADHPFVTVNCAAVPESLLEAEFFGVEAGAATGVVARPGKFELAGKGTIFLDEIGDMALNLQGKLLRAIDSKTVMRVGGTKETPIEARVVAATNMDLDLRERQGLFRRDLLYRLNTVQLALPPLRERPEDIPALTQFFITRAAQEYGRSVNGASDEVLTLFAAFPWPGNVRQLQHVVERAAIVCDGDELQTTNLPPEFRQSGAELTGHTPGDLHAKFREETDGSERALLIGALREADGNISKASRLAGLSRSQFYRLLRKHNIDNNPD